MTIPEKPPRWQTVLMDSLRHAPDRYLEFLGDGSPDRIRFLQKASQDHYVYWDRILLCPLPEGFSPELAWSFARLKRLADARRIPLRDMDGRPFSYNLPDRLLRTLHLFDRFRGTNGGEGLVEEAAASCRVAGVDMSREAAESYLRSGRRALSARERAVRGTFDALQEAAGIDVLTVDAVLRLGRMAAGGDAELRGPEEGDVVVDGRAVFSPPPSGGLESRLQVMCDFANSSEPFVHPLIKAAVLHFWSAFERPLTDGNGRLSRVLFYREALRAGYDAFSRIAVSRVFERSSGRYLRAFLQTEFDGNDLTYFLMFVMESASRALNEHRRALDALDRERRAAADLVRRLPGLNERQYRLVVRALESPERTFAIEDHKLETGVVYQTARTDLLGLVDKELFEFQEQGRRFVFFPAKDLAAKISRE